MDTPEDTPPPLLIIAHACPDTPEALDGLTLPQLSRCLRALGPVQRRPHAPYAVHPPHDTVWAEALGWPTGESSTLPWAAWSAQSEHPAWARTGCAWFSPCHWQIGMEQVTLLPPDALDISDAQSRALMTALSPYAEEDGVHLHYVAPDRWLATGEVLADVPTVSLDRVAYRRLDPWLPQRGQHPQAATLLRWLSEVQMLFYQHPVHDERVQQGQLPVNGIWIHGSGRLPSAPPSRPVVQSRLDLLPSACRHNWAGWRQAWTDLDHHVLTEWAERIERGEAVRLCLCGEHQSLHWDSRQPGRPRWWSRLLQRQTHTDLHTLLGTA